MVQKLMRIKITILLSITLLFVSCCYNHQPLNIVETNKWKLTTKVSLINKKPKINQPKSIIAKLIWEQEDNNYRIKILGLLNVTLATVQGNNNYVIIKTLNGDKLTGNPNKLIHNMMGINTTPTELLNFINKIPTSNPLTFKQMKINYQQPQKTLFGDRAKKMRIQHPNFVLKLANMKWKII